MTELDRLRIFYRLKNVQRDNSVGKRKESPAEHTWSSLVLADYFMTRFYGNLDRLKVYELILYHDVVEIEAGDMPLAGAPDKKMKKELESKSAHKLSKSLPKELAAKYLAIFDEFESGSTLEARFAKAIESLDAEIHEMDYKQDWKGRTEEFLRKHKEKYFDEFPEIKRLFEDTTEYCRKNGYFDQ